MIFFSQDDVVPSKCVEISTASDNTQTKSSVKHENIFDIMKSGESVSGVVRTQKEQQHLLHPSLTQDQKKTMMSYEHPAPKTTPKIVQKIFLVQSLTTPLSQNTDNFSIPIHSVVEAQSIEPIATTFSAVGWASICGPIQFST